MGRDVLWGMHGDVFWGYVPILRHRESQGDFWER